jgi:hypothetical protein
MYDMKCINYDRSEGISIKHVVYQAQDLNDVVGVDTTAILSRPPLASRLEIPLDFSHASPGLRPAARWLLLANHLFRLYMCIPTTDIERSTNAETTPAMIPMSETLLLEVDVVSPDAVISGAAVFTT